MYLLDCRRSKLASQSFSIRLVDVLYTFLNFKNEEPDDMTHHVIKLFEIQNDH